MASTNSPRLTSLLPASFRGIEFLMVQETTQRGQKLAIHEYPNQNKRYAEALGKIPPILTVRALVHGDDFKQRRKDLEEALEVDGQKGAGTLTHPVYGNLQVQAGEFSVASTQTRIGEFIFDITFYQTTSSILPTPLITNVDANVYRGIVFGKVETFYITPNTALDQLTLVDKMLAILAKVEKFMKEALRFVEGGIASIEGAINNFRDNVYSIMQTASGLRNSLENLYNTILQLPLDLATLKIAWRNLTNFDTIDDTIKSPIPNPIGKIDTVIRSNREESNLLLSDVTRLIALAGFMESASATTYETESELLDDIEFLNDRFNVYLEQNTIYDDIITLASDPSIREQLSALKSDSNIALNRQRNNVWKLIDSDQERTSMSLFTYRNYGDLDRVTDIADLNSAVVNVANFNQSIKMLTQ